MKLILPGDPVAQKRARFSAFRGFKRVYDPSSADKKRIRQEIIDQLYIEDPTKRFLLPSFGPECEISIDICFDMPIPKSWPKSKLKRFMNEGIPHLSKPDIDNLMVIIYNAMTGIIYHDDRQITHTSCVKRYSLEPKITIEIEWLNSKKV